ncbi:MAG: phage holin [Bacilli bacterium]|nr:phage holin [Bacilli bacterium]
MSNKVYDVLKWIALVVLPALASLYIGLGQFWNIPYPEQISGTIMLVDAFIGAILGISSIQYAKKGEK